MDLCLRVQKESNKSKFDSYSVRNSVLIITHITVRFCRVHIFCDNLSRKSCIFICWMALSGWQTWGWPCTHFTTSSLHQSSVLQVFKSSWKGNKWNTDLSSHLGIEFAYRWPNVPVLVSCFPVHCFFEKKADRVCFSHSRLF